MLSTRLLRIVLGLLVLGISVGCSTATPLSFQISSGGNENFFYRDDQTSAQVLLTSSGSNASVRRFVAALPAGNSGALVYFLPLSNGADDLAVSLINDTLISTTEDFNNTGIQADLLFSQNATLGVTIVGAVRAMRGRHQILTNIACLTLL